MGKVQTLIAVTDSSYNNINNARYQCLVVLKDWPKCIGQQKSSLLVSEVSNRYTWSCLAFLTDVYTATSWDPKLRNCPTGPALSANSDSSMMIPPEQPSPTTSSSLIYSQQMPRSGAARRV